MWPPPTPPPLTLDTVEGRHADLAARDLLPGVHLVDAGYVSVGPILTAADDHGVQLTGPLPPDTSWQAGDDDAFDRTRFAMDNDAHHVVCPTGKVSRNWQLAPQPRRPADHPGHLPAGLPPLPRPGPPAPALRTMPGT
jgi:hypothetical protein